MEKRVVYILSCLIIVFITFELMLTSLVTGHEAKGEGIMLMTVPGVVTGFCAVIFTGKVLVPRFLLKGKFVLFSLFTFLTAYLTLVAFLEYENIGLRLSGLSPRVEDWRNPLIFLERACDSVILTILLFSIGAYSLYQAWSEESRQERKIAEILKSYIANVKHRLDSAEIMDRLDSIEETLKYGGEDDEEVGEKIDELSDYLRHQLYEIPLPPSIDICPESNRQQRVTQFLTGKRWRPLRHILFQVLLLLMSVEALFSAPDRIEPNAVAIEVVIGMYFLLNALVVINRFWLRKRFRKHKSPRRYIVETVMVVVLPWLAFFMVQAIADPYKVVRIFNPFWIVFLSSLGAMSSFILFEGGVTAIFLLQTWITKQQRVDMLVAETTRQEFIFLKKQINPHFLFNVLNNINILSYDEPEEAVSMLVELKRLVKFQFEETSNSYISIKKEESFLRSYIGLEVSRRDNLSYQLLSDIEEAGAEIPTLLLIPMVENAVKYSSLVEGDRWIEIKMEESGGIFMFQCCNNYNARYKGAEIGGIGLKNVRRRLELLYGDSTGLRIKEDTNIFRLSLRIPVKRRIR